jgi:hypothetical protein
MKQVKRWLLGVLCLSMLPAGTSLVAAQDNPEATTPPPKVLVIFREFVKPGKTGATHERSESAFVQAFTRAKWPTHYFAMDSLSGKPRSLFITGYDSFDAWEKDNAATQKNTAFAAMLDRAALADGELLSDADAGVFTYNEEYSLRGPVDIPHMRYFEISQFQVRQGHSKDWDDLVKMVIAAYQKIPSAHWATFERAYGSGSSYIVITPMKSGAEIDQEADQDKQFMAAMGEDGMKRLGELEAAAIESRQTNLFTFNPRMSYVSDDWIKADPDFWKPKGGMSHGSMHKKATETPAAPAQ